MVSVAEQFRFAAELFLTLVAASGLVLVALRADVARRAPFRALLAAGFVVLGAAAFAHGSLLVPDGHAVALGAGRAAGAVLVAAGALGWAGGRRGRDLLLVGAATTLAGGALEAGGAGDVSTSAVLVAGSLVVAVALLGSARRSIAIRVAASAAGTLLLVVLVLSVSLSSVIATSVQHQQLEQARSRAVVEAAELTSTADSSLESARLVASDLDSLATSAPVAIVEGRAGAATLRARLAMLASFYPVGTVGYLPADGTAVGPSVGLTVAVGGLPAARGLTCLAGAAGSQGRPDVVVVAGQALAVGVFPVCVRGRDAPLGNVVVRSRLDAAYLADVAAPDRGVSLSLVAAGAVVATTGGPGAARAAGGAAPSPTGAEARLESGRFVSVVPVRVPGATPDPAITLVASEPTTSEGSTERSLQRTLFVIALGGTVLALGLAALTGDRITAGLRRLTIAAEGIQEGRTSERVGTISRDEVGSLAGAFDAMVEAVEDTNAALRDAADGETRLRNRLEAVVAGMSDALVAVDSGGRITDFNRAAEELTGTPAAGAIGRPATGVVVLEGDEAESLTEHLAAVGPSSWGVVARLRTTGGTEVPVAVSAGAVRGPAGEPIGSVLVVRDLRREQELERMKTEFLSRVGHELRTPLTGILGYADILLRRDVSRAQARGWHEEILLAAKRQLRIVQLLEFFASAGGGRLMIRPRTIEVDALVSAAIASWEDRLPPGIRLTLRVEPGLPEVMADPRWMSLALDELIDNAVKFSSEGGRVVVRAGPATADAVDISVGDRGEGMSPDEQARAFAEFAQGDASDTRRFGGLGLGLSAVVRVVAGHGGTLQCRSAPGRGTTITVRLPTAARTAGSVVPLASGAAPEGR